MKNELPGAKTCINCIQFDECLPFGATQFQNKCFFAISRFHEQEMEEIFIEFSGSSKRKKELETFLETTQRLNYISKDGKTFGLICSKAGAVFLRNGLKNSPQFKGITKILLNYKP
jgi:hypothetical protein